MTALTTLFHTINSVDKLFFVFSCLDYMLEDEEDDEDEDDYEKPDSPPTYKGTK